MKAKRGTNKHKFRLQTRLTIIMFLVGLIPCVIMRYSQIDAFDIVIEAGASAELIAATNFIKDYMFNIEIALVVFDLLFAIFVSGYLVKPLKKLTDSIVESQPGATDDLIPNGDTYETEMISSSFNQLLRKIREEDRARQEFVSSASHELKTPMTSMKILAESLVSNPDADINLYKEFMGDIISEIDRENHLINDLLSLVRIDDMNREIQVVNSSVNHLISDTVERLRPQAVDKEIELSYSAAGNIWADIDAGMLGLVISNLVVNAMKYNHKGGYVKVNLYSEDKQFVIEVEDNGIGIPEESKELIFDRFYRVDKSHSRKIGGTGLGLAIVRNVVLLHHGTITVDSVLNEGSTFTVKIPMVYKK